jgi:hypothetical protein
MMLVGELTLVTSLRRVVYTRLVTEDILRLEF